MSSQSVEQDENVVKQFQRTPETPVKVTHQTPKRSSRKRSLFQPSSPLNSPSKSDDLGPMSPLSSSSNESDTIPQSPYFSPNGRYSTPPKTPVQNFSQKTLPKRKREVAHNVFPSLTLDTPKSHMAPRTLRRSERFTPVKNKNDNSVTAEDILRDLTTPPRSIRKRNKPGRCVTRQSDVDSPKSTFGSTPCCSKNNSDNVAASKLGIKTISSESFYGPAQPPPKVKTQLFIDSLGSKAEIRKRTRSLSLDSISSNRSFVSGAGNQKRRKNSDSNGQYKSSKKVRDKRPYAGVWHGVKKPKKMKFVKNLNKTVISPVSKLGKIIHGSKVYSKSCSEEKPRQKKTSRKEKNSGSVVDDGIFDPFPHHLVKRKKLPDQTHPSSHLLLNKESDSPDPNKKFMKFGKIRKATLTLNENIKLQYSDGVIKLQSPKKRRKLYSCENDAIFDFRDDDVKNSKVKENIENILLHLENDKETDTDNMEKGSERVQITEITEDQLLNILDSPGTKINIVKGSPSKVLTEIQNDSNRKASNIPLSVDELQGQSGSSVSVKNKSSDTDLKETGQMVLTATQVLSSSDLTNVYPLSGEEAENRNNSEEKFYSLFYKHNWNNANLVTESPSVKNSNKKKTVKIPDDQYLLDAGQRSIGIVTCGKCGVMYQAGDFADEATHKNFHDHLPELRFTGWTNERVVGRFSDGRVIMILSSDNKSWWHKVTKIVDIVDQELGFPEGSVNALFYKTVYLFISDKAKQIVGCLIAEECKEAYKMFPPLEGVEVDSCSKDPSPCKVGISRIWTALNHRRRGVAKRMIDCMRRTFIFGEVVPTDLVAFSVPSPSGKLLAQSVTGKLDFLVYGF